MECLAAVQRGQQRPKHVMSDPPDRSDTTSFVASVGNRVSVQLRATEIVAELIANTQQPTASSAEHPGKPYPSSRTLIWSPDNMLCDPVGASFVTALWECS